LKPRATARGARWGAEFSLNKKLGAEFGGAKGTPFPEEKKAKQLKPKTLDHEEVEQHSIRNRRLQSPSRNSAQIF
jgi:hypothetical protein